MKSSQIILAILIKTFFDTEIQNIDTPCISPVVFESFSCELNSKSFITSEY